MGIVRRMTGVAKHALGMRHCIHLREARGFGGVLFVAAPTEIGHVRQLGHMGDGVGSVLGERPMAGLAPDTGMLAATVHLALLIVALAALLMPGIGDGASADHLECARPVVSVFPEVLRHYDDPDEQEHCQPRN